MPEMVMNASRRGETGKQYAKRIRREGMIPGVLYGAGEDPIPLQVGRSQLEVVLHAGGRRAVINLSFDQEERNDRKAIIREVQRDPIRGDLLHVDLQHISLTETIVVEVPVLIEGVPRGVRVEEGILQHLLHSLELECLPTEIPEHIQVDVSDLGVGDSVHVRDLTDKESRIVTDPDRSIVTVIPPIVPRERLEEVIEEEVETEEIEREGEED